jgi:hypothetical protein
MNSDELTEAHLRNCRQTHRTQRSILLPPKLLPAALGFQSYTPFSLAMSTSNFSATQDLTQEEQTLHHYAAMVKEDLKAYCASDAPTLGVIWQVAFRVHLVFLAIHCYNQSSYSFRKNQ